MRTRSQSWLSAWFSAYIVLWILDGVLRKWVIPGVSDQIYFARDALTLLVLLAILVTGVPREQVSRLQLGLGWLLVVAIVGLAQALTTAQPPLSLAVGVVTFGLPVVAFTMATSLQDRRRELERCQRLILFFLPVQAALTIMQTLSPESSGWNRVGDQGSVGLTTADAVVRATGTFLSPGALSAYTVLCVALLLARLITADFRVNPLLAIHVVSCVLVLALGGSRGAVLGALIVALGAACWAFTGTGSSLARFVRTALSALGVYLAILLTARLFPRVTDAFARRFTEASEQESSSERISEGAFGYFDDVDSVTWLGDGVGSHTLSGIAAGSPLDWIEIELTRWVAELGVLGLVLCVVRQVVTVLLVGWAWRRARQNGSPLVGLIGLAVAPSLLYGSVLAPASQAAFTVVALALMAFAWRTSVTPNREEPEPSAQWLDQPLKTSP